MKRVKINASVDDATTSFSRFLEEKGFKIFCDIDHQKNAQGVSLELPASRVLIFGNPLAGTKLMQKDISMSLNLPLRLAVIEDEGGTYLIHPSSSDFCQQHDVEGHPVLEKIDALFAALPSAV